MAGYTHLDPIIDYKYNVMSALQGSQEIIDLITNIRNTDLESEKASAAINDNFHDYLYVDETAQEARADIMIEAVATKLNSGTIQTLELYIQVLVSKNYMAVNFQGVKGNRLDNLCRYVDMCLRGKNEYGIGSLQIKECLLNSVPEDFVSKMLVYEIKDFAVDRGLLKAE